MRTLILLLFVLLSRTLLAAPNEITVTFKAGDNMRTLAETHLKNPDLWPDILAANGMQAIHEVKQGMVLKIPVQTILSVERTVQSAQSLIQQASRNGARVLATDTINEAIQRHAEALTARRQGHWENASQYASQALQKAEIALHETVAQRNQPLEARLEDAAGTVERRPPGAWAWKAADKGDVLTEQEKLRTLSSSSASIRFRDDSRLQLNANAQLLIRQMRQDNLNQRKQTGIVLQGGDIYALLSDNAKQKGFDVKVDNVNTEVESKNFWVQKNAGVTRFANYEGKLAVASGGSQVVLAENQGTLVKANTQPIVPKDLLPPPSQLDPGDYSVFYKDSLQLNWDSVEGAHAYWLEIAADSQFKQSLVSNAELKDNLFIYPLPKDGLYYWRVASVDNEGLPGAKSKTQFFKVQSDTEPPYLVLNHPSVGSIVSTATITVSGISEKNAVLQSGEQNIPLQADGSFEFEYPLQNGNNLIHLRVRDVAGNESELRRQVTYMSDNSVPLAYDESLPRLAATHFVINQTDFTLKGHSLANAQIQISGANGFSSHTFAGEDGHFQLNLKLSAASQTFTIKASLPSGVSSQETLSIDYDAEAPSLTVDAAPPKLSKQPQLTITGTAQGAQQLTINAKPITLGDNGIFTDTVALQSGDNAIAIIAQDLAGNTTSLQYHTVLDIEAPQLLGRSISPKSAKGGETLKLNIKAADPAGLKAGAAYELDINGQSFNGYLRLCPDRTCYEGELRLPANASGDIGWVSVTLEDYAGNKKVYGNE